MDTTKVHEKIGTEFKGKNILSLRQFDAQSLQYLFSKTTEISKNTKGGELSDLLSGSVTTLLFYEPSSRTFGSFAAAVKKLGGHTLEFPNPNQTSSAIKGESLEDAVRVFESYSDAIILRHSEKGAAQKAADIASIPVINAGDGIGEHPTQALLDLYTIFEKKGRLENLTILIAGDLLNGRTVHSLIQGLSYFKKNTIYLLSPSKLRLSETDLLSYKNKDITLIEIEKETEIPKHTDIWYWTRVQKERFSNQSDYEKLKSSFIVTPAFLETYAAKDTILMHPLPRINEITPEVDVDPWAVYFSDQIRNGLWVRMALMALVLGKTK